MTALRPGMTVREVVPGVPSRVLSLADQLRSIAAGFDQGARVFTPGEGAWFGPAFEAFAAVIGAYPPLYRQVAASFGAASVACRAHALELEAAQAQARVALNRVEDAFALTARWQALPEPRPGSDPGAELLRVLTARVAGAQERVDVSARLAAARLREASKARIPQPHVAFRVISRAVEAQRQFVFGAVEATYDLGRLAATFSPAGIVTDPKGYAASVVGIGAGLKHGVNHPGEFLAAMLDLDTWRTNPARALGRLAPDAAFTVATGGTGAATRVVTATTRGFETLTKTVNPAPTRWLATRLATSDSPSARSLGDLLAHPERGSIGPHPRCADAATQRGGGTAVGNSSARAIIDPGKFDYLFGRVSSNAHNEARSVQNAQQLARVGVYDTVSGRTMLTLHFDEVVADASNISRTFDTDYGTFEIRESLFAGPRGILMFESTWQVTDLGMRLTTVIPKGRS